MPRDPQLVDTFGRHHNNLRVSVTDRCNIRCYYCMPEHPVEFVPRDQILSFEEIERFVRIAVKLGVRKIRVTGGEPLVRKELPVLIRKLVAVDGVEDISLTTNGVLLADQAESLYEAGLRRINIHLDTLDPDRFFKITRRDEIARVLDGIERCRRIGYSPIKINVVAVKNLIEPDIVPMARFGREKGLDIRYIEFMPLDAQGLWNQDQVLLADTMLEMIGNEVGPLEPAPGHDSSAPAAEYRFADGIGSVGFIRTVSNPFCMKCNRIRLTADGMLRYCLFAIEETDVKTLLRGGAPDEEIERVIGATVAAKWEGHEINTSRFVPPPRPMYSIGG